MAKFIRKAVGIIFLLVIPIFMSMLFVQITNSYSKDNVREISAEVMDIEITEAPRRSNPGKMKVKYKYTFDDKRYIIIKDEFTTTIKVGDTKSITVNTKNPQIIMDFSYRESKMILAVLLIATFCSCISGLMCFKS